MKKHECPGRIRKGRRKGRMRSQPQIGMSLEGRGEGGKAINKFVGGGQEVGELCP